MSIETGKSISNILRNHFDQINNSDRNFWNTLTGKVGEINKNAIFGGTYDEYSNAIRSKLEIRLKNADLVLEDSLNAIIESQIQQLNTLIENANRSINGVDNLIDLQTTTNSFLKNNDALYNLTISQFKPSHDENLPITSNDLVKGTFDYSNIATNLSSVIELPNDQKFVGQALFELKCSVQNQIKELAVQKKLEQDKSNN